jgi:GNAT superfamily N-acetyltransferase
LPPGFSIRAPRVEDADAVAGLINARAMAVSGKSAVSVSDILMYWNDPERNIDDEDWLVTAPDGQIIAFMELYEYAPYTVFEVDLQVHPDYDEVGIQPYLLDLIEQRARRELHRAPDGERVALHTFASASDTTSQRHLEGAGFTHIRDHLRMLINLADRPTPSLPNGITIRPMVRNQDERVVWEAVEAAWVDHWGYAPQPFEEFCYFHIESHPTFDPGLWHLAFDGDQLAGVALCRNERAGFENTGWVSVLAVRREYRGRGIGQALLLHAFDDFARRGHSHVGLGVDASSLTGADRLYRRVGMHEDSRERTYEKVLREASVTASGSRTAPAIAG